MNKRTPSPTPPPCVFEGLESRVHLNAAFDYVGITQLRNDPVFAGIDGTGIGVAVLDTGLDRTNTLLAPGYAGGRNIVDGGDNPIDRQDHGTHVAGIIGARNPEIGVAFDSSLIGVKVLGDNGSGTFTGIRDGLRWVYDNRVRYNIQVVNMSLGGGFYTNIDQLRGDILLPEVRRLEAAGITVVSAGGNSYKNREYQNFAAPGIFSTLVVGATWKDGSARNVQWGDGAIDFSTGAGRITSFSQRLVASNTIFAPGAFIRSTVPGDRFENMGGTSQAAPLVTGVVALMQEAAKQFGGRFLSPAEVREIMISTSVNIFDGDDEDDNVTNTQVNYPRIDAYAALQEVRRRLGGTGGGGGGGGGGETGGDPNGVLSGAFLITPALDGSEDLVATGRIGSDFGSENVGAVDVDIFKFELASAGAPSITLSSFTDDPSDFNTYLRLFDAAGNELANNDDANGSAFSQISGVQLSAGVYYVGVSSYANRAYNPAGGGRVDGETGSYTITFSLANDDPNGLLTGAVPVGFGTDLAPASFQGRIGTDYGRPVGRSDVDLFRVVVPDNGTLLIDIDTLDAVGYVDSFLRVFNEAGLQLAFSDDDLAQDLAGVFIERELSSTDSRVVDSITGALEGHVTDSFIRLSVTRGGIYYIGVSDYFNQTYNPGTLDGRSAAGEGGTYLLTFRFVSTDINGSIAQAVAGRVIPFESAAGIIGSDTDPISGAVQLVGDKDVDFVRIEVTRASLIEIDVDSAFGFDENPEPFDATLTLFDSSGSRLAFNDDFEGLDPLIQFVARPGVYFFAVAGYGNNNFDPYALGSGSPGETGRYRVSVRVFASSSVKFVSDDAMNYGRVRTLPVGSITRSVLGADESFAAGSTDVDLYKFVATSNGVLTVNTDGIESFSADTFLRVFESSGKEIAFNDNRSADARGSTVSAPVKKGKTYYIGVSGAGENPRAYNPKSPGRALVGSTGSYEISATFNAPPTLTAVSTLSTADAGQPFTITYDMLAAAANESDPEGAPVSFVLAKLSTGTLTKAGQPVIAGQTRLSPGESVVWTPAASASRIVKAFTVLASDGVQSTLKPVQVSVNVNAPPTVKNVKELKFAAPLPGVSPSADITFAALLSAAGASDKNKDPITFRIESVLSGTLLLNGEAVSPGTTRFGPGQTLTYRAESGAIGSILAFSIRAFDGRVLSVNAPVVKVKFG